MRLSLLFLLPILSSFALGIGNPAQPALSKKGIIRSEKHATWSLRIGYLGDYIYKQRFKDEFQIDDCTAMPTFIKLHTQAGIFTLNFRNRIDFYAIAGTSRIQIDEEAFAKTDLAWGFGGKLVLFRAGNVRMGLDMKYFESTQKPLFFVCDHLPYNIVSDFHLKYQEIQGALGLTYRTKYAAPYIHAVYLLSKIQPQPAAAIVRLPAVDFDVDVVSKSVINHKRWGLALGLTLLDQRKATLTAEWRGFNQNSVNVSGEIRF